MKSFTFKKRENQYACHDLSVLGNKRQKVTFAQSKRFPPKHNLRVRENNSLEQAAFWHEVESCVAYRPPLFLHYVSTIKYH